ncbi:hypothetical protein AURDEDRAFT_171151 [Auricularia subglabra TFB-10046 SS5]|uniref:F-box domain-containing protein n=1 Tax=Auricularia subglabra (strain TFB-10046 / SS5) TaxID=717982 RepID=J0WXJ4_AURST|nr:hypothetical protein AURDEDRAFT_171151 [Auricularia subglabra TFB-10046 SS5]
MDAYAAGLVGRPFGSETPLTSDDMPLELLCRVIKDIPRHRLWRAARICRRFHEVALEVGLCAPMRVDCCRPEISASQLDALDGALLYTCVATIKRVPLSLTVDMHCPLEEFEHSGDDIRHDQQDLLFPRLERALPFLIHLYLNADDCLVHRL